MVEFIFCRKLGLLPDGVGFLFAPRCDLAGFVLCGPNLPAVSLVRIQKATPKAAAKTIILRNMTEVISMRYLPFMRRPFQNIPFCPISVSGSDFNPQNTIGIPAAKILAFLDLEQN
ncbi:MAG: hypothetical protein V3V47_05860 [Desulfobacteria bacterium]